jgi:AraC-like DNA-binding protein
MPRRATLAFDDPLAYQAAIRCADVDLVVTARGDFRAELAQIDCNRLWMQHGYANLSNVKHVAVNQNRAAIAFPADPTHPPAQFCGMEMSRGIALAGPGSSFHMRTEKCFGWAAMSLTTEDLSAASVALTGHELRAGSVTRLVWSDPSNLSRLRRLHLAGRQFAETAPEIFAHPEVCKALEDELVRAMIACLADEEHAKAALGWRHHSAIIRRFEEVLAMHNNLPMYLAEMCAAVGASESTLRACCCEHLGMGPVRYLWLRRMHLARRALQRANSTATVTEIATEHGFGELGRFSVQYRALFGESPSATLRRSLGGAEDPPTDLPANLHSAR